jgi:ABC-type ATPase with predicted acetyltransferase domain
MKNIEVTDEMYNFLIELSSEINTQDNRATAMPYFFQIQTKEEVAVPEDCGIEAWYCDGSKIETEKEIIQVIYDYHEGDRKYTKKFIKSMDSWEREEEMKAAGWQPVNYDYKDKYENAFLTAKACKEHIRLNHYHYNQPVDYLSHAFRNPELEKVYEFLCGLTNKPMHK